MLGHLVLGRYSSDAESKSPNSRENGWMTRVIRSFFRKQRTEEN
jgi:hypothetical protein